MATAKHILLVYLGLYWTFVPGVLVSAQNQETCSGLEQLARNSNSNLLSSCVRDAKCTRVTCQAAGLLSSYIGSVTFTLRPCEAMPGIEMGVFESSGAAIVDQLITSPTTITRRISIASVSIHVFVNSTASSIGISVDPVSVNAGFLETSSYLVSFTSIYLDQTECLSTTQTATTANQDSPNIETCRGLEQLSANTNPNLLSNCVRDSDCTEVTCQGSGILSGQVDSATITLSPCQMPPGVNVELVKDGNALVSQLVTGPVRITHNASFATVEVNFFVNSSSSAIGILIDPFTLRTAFGTSAQYLVSFTSVQLDKSGCTVTTVGDTIVTMVRPTENQEHLTTEPDLDISTTLVPRDGTEANQNPTVSVTTFETCAGLEQLATNTNPTLLENCARDEDCSQVTCQAAGLISSQVDSLTIMLELCETPPGITILILKDGTAIVNQLVTTPTTITKPISVATVEAYVFVNSTANTIGISVDPVSISAGTLGSTSDTLLSFSQVPFNRSPCNSVMSTKSEVLKSTTAENSKVKSAGWIPELSFTVFPLPLITIFTGVTL